MSTGTGPRAEMVTVLTPWTQAERERIGRAVVAAGDALWELGAALIGDTEMAALLEAAPAGADVRERTVTRAAGLDGARFRCPDDLTLEACQMVHDHAPRTEEDR